ncbi:unnamed protein product [Soboliphyme baturini]|uniref:Y+L amino acid transporter 2 n=1 Tax=Soboliphyme baturini TaxID=241478 RepID=A0A183IQU0_9BILA|nr:unnamed protein product [Soboliphyme baturini]
MKSNLTEDPMYKPTIEKSAVGNDAGLKARISLFDGIMVVVGCIIGSGIFISPKGVHENAGSVGLSLIIWVASGLFSMMGAYCYAELGTFITKSGGDYTYVYSAFGPFLAFIRLWIEAIIVRPCTLTVVALTFSIYILRPFYPNCDATYPAPQMMAVVCLLLLTMVNIISVKWVAYVQNVFTVAKLLALALIILTGIALLFTGGDHLTNFQAPFEGTVTNPGKIALAFYSGLWAYNGWNYLNFITEELQNPIRNLPIAIATSITMCIIVYTLTNIAFYAGLSSDELLESTAVAVTFANRYYGVFAWTMSIFVAMSCFGAVNGILLTSSRLFYVGAREKQMPEFLCMISTYDTPIPAVLFTSFLSFLFLILSDNIMSLINCVQIVTWLAIGLATAGLLYLRRKMPPKDFPRPIQVNILFPIAFLIGSIFLVVLPIVTKPADTCMCRFFVLNCYAENIFSDFAITFHCHKVKTKKALHKISA